MKALTTIKINEIAQEMDCGNHWFDFKQAKLENWVIEKFKEVQND